MKVKRYWLNLSKKLNKLRDINFKSRVNISYANSFFRFPGTIYPVINLAIILFAIKLKFLSYEILVPFIYSMQRGNLTFSSFISSLTSLIGSRRQLKLVSDALYKKKEVNQNYVVLNNKKIKVNKKIKLKDIVSISMPNSKRLFSMGNEKLLIDNKKVNSSSFLFNFSSHPKPIVLFGDSGSGKSTYLKKAIGLTELKEECISIHSNISDNIVTPIFDLKGFYMSQDVVSMRSNLKDYLNDYKILNDSEIQDLFNWNKKFQLLWPEINNYKDWINIDLSKSSYGEVKELSF